MKNYMVGRYRTLLCLALTAATMGTAAASTLDVGLVSRASAHSPDGMSFTISNYGFAPTSDMRVYLNGRTGARCAATTAQGKSFALSGALAAGDSVQCSAPAAAIDGHEASITVLGRDQDGATFSHTAHQGYSTAAVPTQPIINIIIGAVFNDTNSNNTFDVGESIDYTYTLYNFGNAALTGVTVTDSLGTTISCPGTTLAVGATMDCSGTHVITAADTTGGPVGNDAFVDTDQVGADSSDSSIKSSSGKSEIKGVKVPLLSQDNDFNNVATVGDLVTYNFAIKNSGSEDFNPVNMTEADPTRIDGPITCNATTVKGAAFSGLGTGALAVGDSVLCTAVHTITSADVTGGQATNLVNITGQPPFGGVASGSAASFFVVPPPPDLPDYVAVPVNNWRAMLLLALGLLAVAGVVVTQRRKRRER